MKKTIYRIIFLILFIGLGLIFYKGYLYKKEINANKKATVCKYIYCEKYPKTSKSFFKYYVQGKLYQNNYGHCPDDNKKINKFFILYYSTIDPNKIEVDFSQEIKVKDKILNAGFHIDELK